MCWQGSGGTFVNISVVSQHAAVLMIDLSVGHCSDPVHPPCQVFEILNTPSGGIRQHCLAAE